MAHLKNRPDYPSNKLSKRHKIVGRKHKWALLADFSLCRYGDNESKPTPTKTLQFNPIVIKSVLESNCKLFRKNALRENFNLKLYPQMDKHFSNQRFNNTHQSTEQKEKCIQRPSFMSERLRTRCKFCMHLQKFRCLPASDGQKHISGNRMAVDKQKQCLTPITTFRRQLQW